MEEKNQDKWKKLCLGWKRKDQHRIYTLLLPRDRRTALPERACAHVHACVRACVRVCVCVCVFWGMKSKAQNVDPLIKDPSLHQEEDMAQGFWSPSVASR